MAGSRPMCTLPESNSGSLASAVTDIAHIFDNSRNDSAIVILTLHPTCTEETLFVWIPAAIFVVFSVIELSSLWRSHRRRGDYLPIGLSTAQQHYQPLPITCYHSFKIALAIFVSFMLLIRLLYWMVNADRSVAISSQLPEVVWLDPWAPILGDFILFLMFIHLFVLQNLYRHLRKFSSVSILAFLFLLTLGNVYSLGIYILYFFNAPDISAQSSRTLSYLSITNQPFMLCTRVVIIFGVGLLLVIYCLTDHDAVTNVFHGRIESEMSLKKSTSPTAFATRITNLHDKLINPESSASYFSRLTFAWFDKLIFKARRARALQQTDLWHLDESNLASKVAPPFEHKLDQWNLKQKEQMKQQQGSRLNAILYLMSIYGTEFGIVCVIKLVASMFIFVNPIVLDWIIEFMNPLNTEPLWKGFLYTTLMFISPMLESLTTSQYEYRINQLTMKMKTAITAAVYRKSLRLSSASRQRYTTGEIVNFIMVDCQRIVEFFNQLNTLWSAPLQIAVGVYLLYLQLGVAAFAGFSFMVIVLPLNVGITRLIKNVQIKMMKEKDSRSKLMDEILNGIKLIKLSAWETHFEQKAMHFRAREMFYLKKYAWYNTLMNTLFSSAVFFVASLSFLTFTLVSTDNVLDANKAFVSLALFNIIRIPLAFLPLVFSSGGIAIVSIKRINDFFSSPEIEDNAILCLPTAAQKEIHSQLESDDLEDEENETLQPEVIRIDKASLSWNPLDYEPLLADLNLSIRKSQLVAIIGPVGAGKSSLLSTLLGDMAKLSGVVQVRGKLAYVPQEAWIRNASIRENIIMNKRYDERRYRSVIEQCELEFDMTMFAAGDATEVGERGINLSGGQKQRISVARAVYSNSDTYLFDDPISALDAHVGKNLFDKVIGPRGSLANKTRLLVTHKLSLLSEVDQIVYISDGTILEVGSFKQLIDKSGPFSEYVAEYFLNQPESTDKNDEKELEFLTQVKSQIKPMADGSLEETTRGRLGSRSMAKLSQSSMQRSSRLTKSQEKQGQLIKEEDFEEGAVKVSNHLKFFRTIGFFICFSTMFSLALSNVFQVLSSLWLSEWANDALDVVKANDATLRYTRIGVYALFGVFESFFSFLGTLLINIYCVVASKLLHNQMLHCILRVPMSFFDTTPIGRIMNRFSRDTDIVDLQIALNVRLLSMQIFRLMVAFGLIALEAPSILLFLFPLTFLYYVFQRLYINTSRQLKRIEAVTRSPLNNFLGESINGAVSIRCYGLVKTFLKEMNRRIDENNRSYWLNFVAARWLAIRLEFLSYTIVFISTVFAVFSKGSLSPGIAGLAISYSLNITSILNIFIRGFTDLETNFVSVERITEYTELETEKSYARKLPPRGWPDKGEIRFDNYSTQYRPGLPMCLKSIDITIAPGNKVAIIGRTGSGKSSLLLALFRLLPAVEGNIFVDKINIEHLGLKDVRSSMRIVPQDPVIFSGTIRSNIDILGRHTDKEIVESLKEADLEDFLESIDHNLDYEITAGSDRLSKGQRQLVTLARGLLDKSKIVVFDESTSAMDHEKESHFHNTLIMSPACKDRTVLMILHRLDRILDYDKVLVLSNGQVAEFDAPRRLVENTQSQFYSLAKEANII